MTVQPTRTQVAAAFVAGSGGAQVMAGVTGVPTLADAGEKVDLADVFETLASLRRIAQQTAADPAAYRPMLQRAERALARGGPPADDVRSQTCAPCSAFR
jgi:hypothetical protein